MVTAGVTLTNPMRSAVRLESRSPYFSPNTFSGEDRRRRSISAIGRLPSITTPIPETTFIASSIGARFGTNVFPVMYCTAPRISPTIESRRISLAKTEKPESICFGMKTSPRISRSDSTITGRD